MKFSVINVNRLNVRVSGSCNLIQVIETYSDFNPGCNV